MSHKSMFIIDNLLIWIAKEVQKMAEDEVTDESKLYEELLKLRTLYELDEIGEEEYAKREEEALKQLDAIRREKRARAEIRR